MQSAVNAFHGVEADWTNFSISSALGNKRPLKLTLDYIVVSDHFRVV